MKSTLSGRSFLKLLDYTPEEIRSLLDLSARLKREKHGHIPHKLLKEKNVVLLFEKTSTRTRYAFEVAGNDLGMGVTFPDAASSQMEKRKVLQTLPGCLEGCMTGLNIAATGRTLQQKEEK